MKQEYVEKVKEYEARKARAKELRLRLTCTICGEKAKLNCPCGTTQYCTTECQRIDWRDRGHRKACKTIRNERAAEAARAEAPTLPPSPPKEIFYGPAPRSHADEIRARIAAEHEAARARREANPAPEPESARFGTRCPVCMEDWDVNQSMSFQSCCSSMLCDSCHQKFSRYRPCPLCRTPAPRSDAEELARIRRHVENEVPEAIAALAFKYCSGHGIVMNAKKGAKLYKRAVELGNVLSMVNLGNLYAKGLGVKLDENKAMQLYRMAADKGNPLALSKVAFPAMDAGDHETAFPLWKRAAEKGLNLAQYFLADAYECGNGVEVDFNEARRWYARAATGTDTDTGVVDYAKEKLKEMDEMFEAFDRIQAGRKERAGDA